jgi:aminomethyltransferase
MCYENGGIVDDLLIYNLGGRYMLVINASNTAKDLAWLRDHLSGEVTLTDRTDDYTLIAVQGPRSLDVLQKLTQVNLAALQYYHCTTGLLAGVDMVISRTGYTGELGFELYLASDIKSAEGVWHAITQAGREFGIGPVGLGARDTLRLEMGFCLYGNDIDQKTNPVEAGLGWITKTDKGSFIGRDAILSMKQRGPKRKLVGFSLQERGFPRHGYPLFSAGKESGVVTSGTVSPTLDKGIGMGYIDIEFSRPGTEIAVGVRGRQTPAAVVPLPFIAKR